MDSDVESDIASYHKVGSDSGLKSGKVVNGLFYD